MPNDNMFDFLPERFKKTVHYVAAAIIKRGNKYLVIERATPPYGYAFVTGHQERRESIEDTLKRETEEEVGLIIKDKHCIFLFRRKLENSRCYKEHPSDLHRIVAFLCEVEEGEPVRKPDEVKKILWLTKEQIESLKNQGKLENTWERLYSSLEEKLFKKE